MIDSHQFHKGLFIIVGSGVGGLATALALQRKGIQVKVYERDESFDSRSQGYSLTLQQGLQALEQLGVGKQVRSACGRCKISAHQILKSNGETMIIFDRKYRTKKSKGNLPIPRQQLRKVLHDALLPDTIQWSKQLTSFEVTENNVKCKFSDGEVVVGEALIGCDGIHSLVRKELIGDPIQYLGVVAINGITETDHALMKNRVTQTLDGSSRMFTKPFNKGSSMWQLTFPVSIDEVDNFPFTDLETVKRIALEKVEGWHPPMSQLVLNTPLSKMRTGPIYDRTPLNPWTTTRATLLGDSAHPMSPFKGQGANQALQDAVDIADLLDKHSDVLEAFRMFEPIMLRRARKFQIGSRNAVYFYHKPDAVDHNQVLDYCKLHGEKRNNMINIVQQIQPIQ
jgi:salicylate hydroxylase